MAPYIKGGVWTNVEDEILKAAISKYGLNQWARVSSLLARKTAKQCKARWNEWLDPSIKKIEWSREEDEKLLHLAKLMPSQWRSIAPIVGRTANQCIERYQKLLDDAEQRERGDLSLTGTEGDASAPAEDSRRVIVGSSDTLAEARPARPDAIDMDDDEKEMLSEARARLANTQGKKAKRKDRERLLAETNRLAMLQKRRELKQAGINMKLGTKKSKTSIDYNADIPFQHKPAPGVYDTSEEKDANLRAKNRFDKLMKKKGIIRGETKDDDDRGQKRKELTEEQKQSAADQAAAARAHKLQQINQSEQIAKRRKLELPAPQVQDNELERIVKQDKLENKMRSVYMADDSGLSSGATSGLLPDHERSKGAIEHQSTRTPQISADDDYIYKATRDVRDLTATQSSLLGGESVRESSTATSIVPPGDNLAGTPNPLVARARVEDEEGKRPSLIGAFCRLPKPKNDFEIAIPEEEEQEMTEVREETDGVEEDAGEREKELKALREVERQKAVKRRSQVIQRNLPRPLLDNLPKASKETTPQALIEEELRKLVISDSIKYPAEGVSQNGFGGTQLPDLDDETRALAEQEISAELITQSGKHNIESTDSELAFGPEVADKLVESLSSVAEKANKNEKKLSLVLGGYMKRQEMLSKKLSEAHEAYQKAYIDSSVYAELRDMESIALTSRISSLQEEVNFLADAERTGQERYRYLKDEIQALQANEMM
ncbi:hypothetical protein TRICI_001343 [Trichomonascus ciferrii]|uniref:Pre-mRNA-splicing factor CEF1 n=1 Tax=Trichomonascus ciferrii TaxID=44093 RepID=A0A642V8N5_9ASCO|nr:hypothetical protein TRICI_001343 [Trichomonascus ciferrii]